MDELIKLSKHITLDCRPTTKTGGTPGTAQEVAGALKLVQSQGSIKRAQAAYDKNVGGVRKSFPTLNAGRNTMAGLVKQGRKG